MVDLQRLRALRDERQRVQEAFVRHGEECRAAEPHPYASCQFRYEKLQERLEDLDRTIGLMLRAANRPAAPSAEP